MSLPHVRGGVSFPLASLYHHRRSSPRAWGCFLTPRLRSRGRPVFPTCVGVFPSPTEPASGEARLPHVRGGVSSATYLSIAATKSSPRAWGCFLVSSIEHLFAGVFPTCVGVFLFVTIGFFSMLGSSPRAWGCFLLQETFTLLNAVFPTCVGVFLISSIMGFNKPGLPHVRGGVSIARALSLGVFSSSPRAWGCFLHEAPPKKRVKVFPTCVGVFLISSIMGFNKPGLPHVRGGVSAGSQTALPRRQSSPRAWGCFAAMSPSLRRKEVFPTCVGVFPCRRA